jgi:uncharacterized protein involved in tellurium resistance
MISSSVSLHSRLRGSVGTKAVAKERWFTRIAEEDLVIRLRIIENLDEKERMKSFKVENVMQYFVGKAEQKPIYTWINRKGIVLYN